MASPHRPATSHGLGASHEPTTSAFRPVSGRFQTLGSCQRPTSLWKLQLALEARLQAPTRSTFCRVTSWCRPTTRPRSGRQAQQRQQGRHLHPSRLQQQQAPSRLQQQQGLSRRLGVGLNRRGELRLNRQAAGRRLHLSLHPSPQGDGLAYWMLAAVCMPCSGACVGSWQLQLAAGSRLCATQSVSAKPLWDRQLHQAPGASRSLVAAVVHLHVVLAY